MLRSGYLVGFLGVFDNHGPSKGHIYQSKNLSSFLQYKMCTYISQESANCIVELLNKYNITGITENIQYHCTISQGLLEMYDITVLINCTILKVLLKCSISHVLLENVQYYMQVLMKMYNIRVLLKLSQYQRYYL